MILNYNFRTNFRLVLYVCFELHRSSGDQQRLGQDSGLVQKQAWGCAGDFVMAVAISLILIRRFSLTTGDLRRLHRHPGGSSSVWPECKRATRWIEVAGIQFQPSEFVKHGMIVFSSWFLARTGKP